MNDVIRPSDLGGADLSEAEFSTANRCEAVLRGTNLAGADFYEARLVGSDLGGADLSGARLIGADFSGPASPVPSQGGKTSAMLN